MFGEGPRLEEKKGCYVEMQYTYVLRVDSAARAKKTAVLAVNELSA